METIGDRIRFLRESKKMTQPQLAEVTGISKGNVSELENNHSAPSTKALLALSQYFNVTTDWILMGDSSLKKETTDNSIVAESEAVYKKFDPLVEDALKDDPELKEFWGEMISREDLRLLFKKTKPLKPRTVKQIIAWIKAIEDEESQQDD